MTLHFAQEVIVVESWPIVGTVTVQVHASDPDSRLWQIDLEVAAFEPESFLKLTWRDVRGPCETWLAENKARVERKALNHRE